jgi:hypothetical protein
MQITTAITGDPVTMHFTGQGYVLKMRNGLAIVMMMINY